MKKLIILGLISLLTLSEAKMVGGIALIVEGEAVTTSDIRTLQKQTGLSKEKAIDLLIQEKLQKNAMRDIVISESDIDQKIEQIASQNNISVKEMQKIFKKQGSSWSDYRTNIKEKMKISKFIETKIADKLRNPSEDDLKLFYKHHKKEFKKPGTISFIEYSTTSEEEVRMFLLTQVPGKFKKRSMVKKTDELNPALLEMLTKTENGTYTRPFNAGNRYVVFYVKSKTPPKYLPFEEVKNQVAARWMQQEQQRVLKDYFKKKKISANIQVLRE